jgi:hypothetical protein
MSKLKESKIFAIGFVYVDKPSFPHLVLPECGYWTTAEGAQKECNRRNDLEQEMSKDPEKYPDFQQGFWSLREFHLND